MHHINTLVNQFLESKFWTSLYHVFTFRKTFLHFNSLTVHYQFNSFVMILCFICYAYIKTIKIY